jgi:hypothetical protein
MGNYFQKMKLSTRLFKIVDLTFERGEGESRRGEIAKIICKNKNFNPLFFRLPTSVFRLLLHYLFCCKFKKQSKSAYWQLSRKSFL